ncbi:nucleotidyltransferase domain-containing protein [Heliobacillus mobilis]|uniref:Nucleotidyltransferase domain-containing protein n=1 Tax=Heliobacterium mobile TaxID=28064 RepID=A0A6I3SEZ0_HELMO|nr:nucleotidyltransferase domain-containing protein [Heliobacterium mobile]MTV47390.1 nucleotidyltransferase domain-containing protein [Heliobacterium mobile]
MNIHLEKKLIENIRSIGQKYAIDKIVLFGSRARGESHRTSDIDLAVYPLPEFNLTGHLSSDLDDLDTLLKIDVVFIGVQTNRDLIEIIEKEGVLLYDRT